MIYKLIIFKSIIYKNWFEIRKGKIKIKNNDKNLKIIMNLYGNVYVLFIFF